MLPQDDPAQRILTEANGGANFLRYLPVFHGVRYVAYGHSFGKVQGSGATANVWGASLYPIRVRDTIRADTSLFYNLCVSNDQMKDTAQRMIGTGSNSWTPLYYGLVTLMGNQNDVGRNRTAQGILSYKHSLRACLSMLRASSRIEASAATAVGATTSGTTSSPAASGGSFIYTNTAGATFTWSGATFTDATVMLGGFYDGSGANYEVRVDGVLLASGPTASQHTATTNDIAGNFGPIPVQLRNLTNTPHTVEVKHAGGGTTLCLDALIPWSNTPPQVILVKDTPCLPAGYNRYPSPPTDADVTAWNGYMADVAAEFPADGSLTFADANTGWDKTTMIYDDGQHPNDHGSAFIAAAIIKAMAPLPYRRGLNLSVQP